jgi:Flp pilus assembly protein TadD
MKTRTLMSLGLSSLVLGGSMVGCTATNQGGLASAGTRDSAIAAKVAARDAVRARAALAKGQTGAAVSAAEAAVALMPQNAGYRSLLGQGYLKTGRFASARAAFTDALALEPADGRAALNLVLSQIALGDWQAARGTMDSHAGVIAPADRGLALALSGDPEGGAKLLTEVIRAGQSTPKLRQNLALALALAGQWQGARVVAAADMSPAEVDRRLEQWAVFAKPKSSSEQVAALLGVVTSEDPGQPVTLALTAPVPVGGAVADVQAVASTPHDAPVAAAPVLEPVAVAMAPQAKSVEPAPLLRAESHPVKVAVARRPVAAPPRGNWFVQVGAFRNAKVARDGWRHATRRMPALARHTPTEARFAAKGGAFYRLAFGGFSRGDADATCRRYRASGGACFVRGSAGDQIASWVAKPVRVAARVKPIQLASR